MNIFGYNTNQIGNLVTNTLRNDDLYIDDIVIDGKTITEISTDENMTTNSSTKVVSESAIKSHVSSSIHLTDGISENNFALWNTITGKYEPKTIDETKTIMSINSTDDVTYNSLTTSTISSLTSLILSVPINEELRLFYDGVDHLTINPTGANVIGQLGINSSIPCANCILDGSELGSTVATWKGRSAFGQQGTGYFVSGLYDGVAHIGGHNGDLTSWTDLKIGGIGAKLFVDNIYDNAITGRDLFIATNGEIGYNSSLRNHKINIIDLTNTSFIYNLKPRQYNRRKKIKNTETGKDIFTDIPENRTDYGLIAEEVELINSEVCDYNYNTDGTKRKLMGVLYKNINIAMLSEMKNLRDENIALRLNNESLLGMINIMKGNIQNLNDSLMMLNNNINSNTSRILSLEIR